MTKESLCYLITIRILSEHRLYCENTISRTFQTLEIRPFYPINQFLFLSLMRDVARQRIVPRSKNDYPNCSRVLQDFQGFVFTGMVQVRYIEPFTMPIVDDSSVVQPKNGSTLQGSNLKATRADSASSKYGVLYLKHSRDTLHCSIFAST